MSARRWIKRCLKWGVEWGTELSGVGFMYRRTRTFREGLRILTYHRISDRPKDSFTVHKDHFRDHMAYLAENCLPIDLRAASELLPAGPVAQGPAVAVTFDDGYKEAADHVRDVLERFRIPATFFVVTGILDSGDRIGGGPYLDWDDVRELAAAGFEIGSHGVSHISLGRIGSVDIRRELSLSRDRIEEELGQRPVGFSFPYGTLRDFSPETARMVEAEGFGYAVTAIHGLNRPGCDLFTLRRTTLTAGDGLRTFRLIMKGNLDPWFLVDRLGYRLQRPGHGEARTR